MLLANSKMRIWAASVGKKNRASDHILGQVPSILGLSDRFRHQHRSMASPRLGVVLLDGVDHALDIERLPDADALLAQHLADHVLDAVLGGAALLGSVDQGLDDPAGFRQHGGFVLVVVVRLLGLLFGRVQDTAQRLQLGHADTPPGFRAALTGCLAASIASSCWPRLSSQALIASSTSLTRTRRKPGRTFSARFCISAMRLIVVLLAGSVVSGRIISVMSSTPCAVHCTEQVRPKSGVFGHCTVHGARPFPGMLGLVLHCTGVVPWGAKDNYATPWVLMAYRVFGSSGQEQRHSPQGHDPTPTRPDTDPMHSTANAD